MNDIIYCDGSIMGKRDEVIKWVKENLIKQLDIATFEEIKDLSVKSAKAITILNLHFKKDDYAIISQDENLNDWTITRYAQTMEVSVN